jgi:hypothetical protein
MGRWAVLSLRVIIAIALVGALVVQVGAVAIVAASDDGAAGTRLAMAVIVVLGVACLQLIGVSIWRLTTLVRRGTVFSHESFRHVDRVIAALATGAVLVFAIAVVARFANHHTPGDEVAPGLVGLICGLALVVGGVALVVYVLRALLAQAVALDSEAKALQSELDGVI